ncbi:hypothetical protein GOP47_0027983 [Adiantum capillus-veneris]|nr:hypothetical protein GOP47_0027983 [Adiantum capillus-veneris]
MRDIRSLKERWLVGFENAEREKKTLESPRGSEDVSIGKGEQGLVSHEMCVQPVVEKSEDASVEEAVMSFCDDESMCEEVVQLEGLCNDVSDDIGFFDSLLSEAGVDVSFSFTFGIVCWKMLLIGFFRFEVCRLMYIRCDRFFHF